MPRDQRQRHRTHVCSDDHGGGPGRTHLRVHGPDRLSAGRIHYSISQVARADDRLRFTQMPLREQTAGPDEHEKSPEWQVLRRDQPGTSNASKRQVSLFPSRNLPDRNRTSLTHSRKPISNVSNDRSRAGTGRSTGRSRMSVKSHMPSFPAPPTVAAPASLGY